MSTLKHAPFEQTPRYTVQASEQVLSWFVERNQGTCEKIVQVLFNDERNPSGTQVLQTSDAFRLMVQHRRDDLWQAIVGKDPENERFFWGLGRFREETWNHDPHGLEWFLGLDEKLHYFRHFDVVTAMAQCQDFCTGPDEYKLRQRIVSKITMVQPRTVQQNPTMWEFIVNPNLEFLERCLRDLQDPPLEARHFDHLRAGAFEHFSLLRELYGNMRGRAMWAEMKRFVEEGPASVVDEPLDGKSLGVLLG